jgi:hypothetical protein
MRETTEANRTDLEAEQRRFDEGGAGSRQGHEGNFSEGWEAGYTHGYQDGYDHGSSGQPFHGNAREARLRQAGKQTTGDASRAATPSTSADRSAR